MSLARSISSSVCVSVAVATFGCGKSDKPVNQAELFALIGKADQIVVSENSRKDGDILYSSTNSVDIEDFRHAVSVIQPTDYFHCMCYGSLLVRLYHGTNELVWVSNHHGRSIRCSLWSSDAMLADQEKWLKWFDSRNMGGPRKEVEDEARRAEESRLAHAKWVAALPEEIRPTWEKTMNEGLDANLGLLRSAFAKKYTNKNERILALLSWYGSGKGPWSGFPAYEDTAEKLLLEYSTPDILAAINGITFSAQQMEGCARLFGGWSFYQSRPNDRDMLPSSLKKVLLDHSLKTSDEDKLSRAKNAFGS